MLNTIQLCHLHQAHQVWLLKPASFESAVLVTLMCCAFSALTLLVGRQEGHPACKKLQWWGAGMVICLEWGAGMVICLEWGADLHLVQLMPLPLTVCCFSKIQIGFTFLVPAHPGSPGQRPVKRVSVYWQQSEICTVNNDKLQGSILVAKHYLTWSQTDVKRLLVFGQVIIRCEHAGRGSFQQVVDNRYTDTHR